MKPYMQIDDTVLYGTRLLVFIETEPQSNKYRQLMLTPEEFKNVSFSIGKVTSKVGDEEQVEVKMSEKIWELPDLPEIYET